MRYWNAACAVVVGTLGPAATARAQISSRDLSTITLDAALARAAHRPSVALRELDLAAAAARARGADLPLYNPELTLGAGPQFGGAQLHPRLAVGLSQAVELGGKRGARAQVAGAQTAAVRVARDDDARRARIDAWRAFAHAQLARDRLVARGEVERLAQALAAAIQRAAQAGGAPALRVHLVVAEAGRAAQQRSAAETDYAEARARLATAIGAAADEDLAPAGDAPGLAGLPASPRLARPERGPVVREARAEAELARARIAEADARGVSDVTLGVEYDYAPDPDGGHAIVATLAYPLALRNRNAGEREAARIVARQAERAVIDAGVEAERAARLALASYQRARASVAGLDREVSQPLDASLAAAQDAFRHGGLELVELIAIQRSLVDARLASLDARLALIDAWAELALTAVLEVAP